MSGHEFEILQPSLQSLFVEICRGDIVLGTGTAFFAKGMKRTMLITNRHNVTGRRQDNNRCLSPSGGIPDKLVVWQNSADNIGGWITSDYMLIGKNDEPLWIEHPTLGSRADFVGLAPTLTNEMIAYPYDLGPQHPPMIVRPADAVSVVGFPFGQNGGGLFAIWATGFVATEPEIDLSDLPTFLIDCRTRRGQSGSPVIAHRNGGAIPLQGQTTRNFYIGPITNFLGVYSGRINEESDLGIVWKRSAIAELVDSGA